MQPTSSSRTTAIATPPTAAEEREAAVNNPPRRKRRRIATGHEIAQRAEEASRVSSLLSQLQEQPTSPPIEQRHVAGVAAAERVEADHPKPAAAFAKAPAADEPLEIEAEPDSDEIPFEELIANFLPRHQEEIRQRLNDKDIQQVLNEVGSFLKMLKDNGIKLTPGRGKIPTPSLFGRLKNLTLPGDAQTYRNFFEKATVFFSVVNTSQVKSTSCLSGMLDSNTHVTKFANETEDNLRLLASHPYLKQITSMCDRKGVPDPVKAAEIIDWDCWKIDGTFSLNPIHFENRSFIQASVTF